MRKSSILLCLFLTSCGSGGGGNTEPLTLPVVRIEISNSLDKDWYCSGVILSENTVLFAAHCLTLVNGTPTHVVTLDGHIYPISNFSINPLYTSRPTKDVALATVTGLKSTVNAEDVVISTRKLRVGDTILHYGFGRDEQGQFRNFKIRELTITDVHDGYFVTSEGPCFGDSGGGLYYQGELVGITSKVTNDCQGSYKHYATDVNDNIGYIEGGQ